MASASSMHEAGHPKLVLWGNPEGRGGEGAASRVQGQGIHVYLRLIRDEGGQKTPQCCQVIVLQLNKFLRYLYMIWGVKQSDVVSGSAYMHIFIYPASLGLLVSVHAKLLQSCPTLCDPMDCSPPGSSVHGDAPGKNTGVGCHVLLQGIFPTQGLNLRSLASSTSQADYLPLSYWENPT